MRQMMFAIITIVLVITLAGCAAGPNEMMNIPNQQEEIAGFWRGLWHGIIAPITFIISLFSDKVEMYEVHNNGGWYNFGFVLGASIIFGGGSGGAACRRRRRYD